MVFWYTDQWGFGILTSGVFLCWPIEFWYTGQWDFGIAARSFLVYWTLSFWWADQWGFGLWFSEVMVHWPVAGSSNFNNTTVFRKVDEFIDRLCQFKLL